MQLITTKNLCVFDAAHPKMPNGFFPDFILRPGAYDLEEIPNPSPQPDHIKIAHWCPTWLVVRGTKRGIARNAIEHNYVHHHDPSVTVIL